MQGKREEILEALDRHIERIRAMRERWASGEGLSPEELARREITLELLDGSLKDLIARREKLEKEQG
jgi:hypothetical protein